MRWALLLCGAAGLLAGGRAAHAQAPDDLASSFECCNTLLYPVGARVVSLGGALAARAIPDALFVNPAAIASLGIDELRAHSERTDINKTTSLALSFGLGPVGTAALSYWLLDWGDIEASDEFGNPTGTLSYTHQAFSASFATAILPHLNAGVTYRVFMARETCSGFCGGLSSAGTTHLLDLGARADVPWVRSLQLGVSATSLGPALQVKNAAQRDPAPTRVHFGAAYELLQHFATDSTLQLIASADLQRGVRSGIEPAAALGLELIMDGSLFLRGGYATGSGQGTGAALGVGLIWDRFDVSVAKSFVDYEVSSEPFQITFAVRF
jgi:hypothetical protein